MKIGRGGTCFLTIEEIPSRRFPATPALASCVSGSTPIFVRPGVDLDSLRELCELVGAGTDR